MWWWFLTSGNTVQEENFHRILMKLLMRQHGTPKLAFEGQIWMRVQIGLLYFQLPSPSSVLVMLFCIALVKSLQLHWCFSWTWLHECLWQCKANEQGSKSPVATAKKVSCLCMFLALESSSESPSECTVTSLVPRWGQIPHRYWNEMQAIVLKIATSRGSNIILRNFIQCLLFQEASVEKMKWILKITIKHM